MNIIFTLTATNPVDNYYLYLLLLANLWWTFSFMLE